jgi:glycolate oxidase
VAENSGGVHCLKYGLTLHNVLQVRVFTAQGEPITFGSEALDAPGYDLLSLAVGSEGMLAVTIEVLVKLVPKPQLARCIMASFDDVRKAGEAVAAVIAAGIIPAGLEMMDKPMTAAVEDFVHAGYDLNAEAILLCESDGTPEEVEEEIGRMSAVLQSCGATAIAVSKDEAERLKFWSGRKNAFPASGRISPDYMCMDSTIPRKRLADILLAIAEMEKKYGLRCANVFHAGDGNLHPLILFDANDPDQLHRRDAVGPRSAVAGKPVAYVADGGAGRLSRLECPALHRPSDQPGPQELDLWRAARPRLRPGHRCQRIGVTGRRLSAVLQRRADE